MTITSVDDPDWFRARTASGSEGLVPSNYVEFVRSVPTEAKPPPPPPRRAKVVVTADPAPHPAPEPDAATPPSPAAALAGAAEGGTLRGLSENGMHGERDPVAAAAEAPVAPAVALAEESKAGDGLFDLGTPADDSTGGCTPGDLSFAVEEGAEDDYLAMGEDDTLGTPAGVSTSLSDAVVSAARSRFPDKRAVVDALFHSEEQYVQLLNTLVDVFARDVRVRDTTIKRALLADHRVAIILALFEQILQLNARFLAELDLAVADDSGEVVRDEIGAVLERYTPRLSLYTQFVVNLEDVRRGTGGWAVGPGAPDWLARRVWRRCGCASRCPSTARCWRTRAWARACWSSSCACPRPA